LKTWPANQYRSLRQGDTTGLQLIHHDAVHYPVFVANCGLQASAAIIVRHSGGMTIPHPVWMALASPGSWIADLSLREV